MSATAAPARRPAPAWRPDTPASHPVRILAAWVDLGARAAARRRDRPRRRGPRASAARCSSPRSSRSSTPSSRRSSRRCGCRSRSGIGFIAVLAADAAALLIAADAAPQHLYVDGFALRARRLHARLRREHGGRARSPASTTTRRTPTGSRAASRGAPARRSRPTRRGSSSSRSTASPCPVLRRAIRDGTTPVMARWLADGSHKLIGVGDRPLLADGREPGGDPARRQPRHPGVPLGRQGVRAGRDLLEARGLRGDRGVARRRVAGCSPTAAPAAGTCSPATPTRRS